MFFFIIWSSLSLRVLEYFFFYFLALDFVSFKRDLVVFNNWFIYWSQLVSNTTIQTIHLIFKQFYQLLILLCFIIWLVFIRKLYYFEMLVNTLIFFTILFFFSGIVWINYEPSWDNWWFGEDFEELVFLSLLFLIFSKFHYFKKSKNMSIIFLFLLISVYFLFLYNYMFITRHITLVYYFPFVGIILFYFFLKKKYYSLSLCLKKIEFFFYYRKLNLGLITKSKRSVISFFSLVLFIILYYLIIVEYFLPLFNFIDFGFNTINFNYLDLYIIWILYLLVPYKARLNYYFFDIMLLVLIKKEVSFIIWAHLFYIVYILFSNDLIWLYGFGAQLLYSVNSDYALDYSNLFSHLNSLLVSLSLYNCEQLFTINIFYLFIVFIKIFKKVWGDLPMLQFYPRSWQSCFYDSVHSWLLYMSMWHYWMWVGLTVLVVFYFGYLFKSFSYFRVDIRGKRPSGEKRRIAWPELLTCMLPFFWGVNIVSNAFMYMRLIESSGGYALLSVHVTGYQWGWRYAYPDSFYYKILSSPLNIGSNIDIGVNGNIFSQMHYTKDKLERGVLKSVLKALNEIEYTGNEDTDYKLFKVLVVEKMKDKFGDSVARDKMMLARASYHSESKWSYNFVKENLSRIQNGTNIIGKPAKIDEMLTEIYFCRRWLKKVGTLESEKLNLIKNKVFQVGFWVTAQGMDPNVPSTVDKYSNLGNKFMDPLRLLRSTGSLVLPTRVLIRLMASSDDVTHSWAVPGIGLKIDCVPGRLFCVFNAINREGIYFGQCSELCGWNHYNMPVSLFALPLEHFLVWWELELHSVYNDLLDDEQFIDNKVVPVRWNYSLLNAKYK